jgi:hypothetical protein
MTPFIGILSRKGVIHDSLLNSVSNKLKSKDMNTLQKYELINKCETYEELAQAILKIGEYENGIIKGRNKVFKSIDLAYGVKMGPQLPHPSYLTRVYGIRQQYLYIKFYEEKSY